MCVLLGNSGLTQMSSCAHLSCPVHVCFVGLRSQLLSVLSLKHSVIRTVTDQMNASHYLTLTSYQLSYKTLTQRTYRGGIQITCSNITTFCWAKKYPLFSSSLYFPIASVKRTKKNLLSSEQKKHSLTLKSLGIPRFSRLKSEVTHLF